MGNIRATFKTEPEDPDIYLATLEDDASTKAYEETYFSRYDEITRINADIFDHTDEGMEKTYSMRLSGTGNEIYGLAKSLSVMPGDVVSAEVWAKYLDPSSTGSAGTAFAQLIEDLSNNASSVVIDAISPGSEAMPSFIGLLGGNGEQNAGAPMAYLNLMVFDLNFQQVENTLFKQISTAAQEDGSDISHEYISINPVTITEPGYVYIYLSNENTTPVEVFFDDFEVTHTPTDIVQKDDYYPFGGRFNSYSQAPENKYLYNGKELIPDLNLNLYDYGARFYDPAIARWTSSDPMAEMYQAYSPYNYTLNNPVRLIDPNGMWVEEADRYSTNDPNEIRDFISQQQGKDEKGKTYEGGTLDEVTVTASRINDGENFGRNYSLGDFGTGLSLAGEGMWLLGENRSTSLYQQGFRRGLSGNYQLTGRNLSLFGNQPMTSATKPFTSLNTIGNFGKVLSNTGTYLSGASAVVDTYSYTQGNLSGARYSYHMIGTGSSLAALSYLGGPYGAAIGGLFFLGEKVWDMGQPMRNEISSQYWQFKNDFDNALRSGWRPR
ncbi:RHS repeat-associated core domain-containing protein [Algoriphagus sp. C2-6-M1]|uniref:RHS repeat-associated core domain-containing protein n=1 Tax=Algoriphagus persicinus TaxID=3108754 RepID=UPI002B36E55F|nr:RHS repeat-associated core domain-containing protein [Algoriphagus sp. C2-6-M1]MEB2779594.1 RHS repeat-associated core domain-containing protein [Algoriphagus sp. C2-6-M1]